MDQGALAAFQEDLLRALDTARDPADVTTALVDHRDPVLARWMASWDADLVSLACELVRTWAAIDDQYEQAERTDTPFERG